jgi:hypothetical protein
LFKIKKPKKQEERAKKPRQNKNKELRYLLSNKKPHNKKAILMPTIINKKPNKYLKFI